MTTTTYRIQSKGRLGWEDEPNGAGFSTEGEAEQAIQSLRELDEERAAAEYRVVRDAQVSDDALRGLEQEAAQAGDDRQVALCRAALAGDQAARARCAETIADAQGQA